MSEQFLDKLPLQFSLFIHYWPGKYVKVSENRYVLARERWCSSISDLYKQYMSHYGNRTQLCIELKTFTQR